MSVSSDNDLNDVTRFQRRASPVRRCGKVFISRPAGWIYWGVNLLALTSLIGWICLDGKFTEAAFGAWRALVSDAPVAYSPLLAPRVHALQGLLVAGAASCLGILLTLFVGSTAHRGLRSWLVLMCVLAGWLTLITTWPNLVWRAQAWRVQQAVSAADRVADQLLANWPKRDGKLDSLGPFMAYPIGNPRTLMFLKTPHFSETDIEFTTVERSRSNRGFDLHFQLAGNEEGSWLVRTADGESPKRFFSGLSGEYRPQRVHRLGAKWFLVVYVYTPIIDATPSATVPLR